MTQVNPVNPVNLVPPVHEAPPPAGLHNALGNPQVSGDSARLMHWINRLELRLGRFAIANLMHYIAGLNVLTFVLYKLNPHFFELLDLDPALVRQGEVWRLVTYIFIPSIGGPLTDFLGAFLYVMFLLFLGNGLEQAWGAFRLNLFYLLGMIGTTVAAFFFGASFSNVMLNSSLFFAFARFYPETVIYVFFILPVRIKWLAWISAAWFLLQFMAFGNSYRAALVASLANYFLFFGKDLVAEASDRRQGGSRKKQFRAVQSAQEEPLHRCVVCQRTDQSHPELEFRVGKDGNDYCLEHLPK